MIINEPIAVIVEPIIADLLITAYRTALINNAVTVIVLAITELVTAVTTPLVVDPITVVVDPIADLRFWVTPWRADLVDLPVTVVINTVTLLRALSAETRAGRIREHVASSATVVITVIVRVTRGACDEAHSSTATIAVTARWWIAEVIVRAPAVTVEETLF